MEIKLSMSGSGPRFPVFAGAYKRLEEEGCKVSKVMGTSGGSIIASCIASGMTGDQTIKLCKDIMPKLSKLISFNPINLISKWGLDDGNRIQTELTKHVVSTFKDTFIPLFITATNFDTEDNEVFHLSHSPDMPVAKAVRMSMSMPLVFMPVEHNNALYVDGGVKYNFPFDYFIDGPDVVGLYINEDLGGPVRPRPTGPLSFVLYIVRVINMMIGSKTESSMSGDIKGNAIPINTTANGLDFSLDAAGVDNMIHEGYISVDNWIKKNPGKLK